METVRLGKTGLVVSKNGFGALPIQRVGMEDAVKIIRKAYDNGINYFDTAYVYSDSEEKIGLALAYVLGFQRGITRHNLQEHMVSNVVSCSVLAVSSAVYVIKNRR